MKYNVHITFKDGLQSILSHRGKTEWSKRVAKAHADSYKADFSGHIAKIEIKEA